ncbi:NADH-quinone oxidoreductase subunit J [Acidisoma cellulosilytica]|uniref:NADH-quinone oxidoreductase subunit J n=1 Tax=Acidisoma cellulosilyticum TaxID=2802395 RepID=A0A963Z3E1_9PROT|nr:NADH-quinone oxidoreductase subunit J [Acidisoma cellulosilyticum]MCB8881871.1 NADH-quinone oxidoreductase subunit J [Acidisoma cellulosilyticum]
MIFAQIFFYIFAAILIVSAVMVVTSRNPVHSVLFLILCFFNAAALFLIAGAEFLAFILLIVYVGAVAVLFLFVVMMLDIDFTELRAGVQRYAPIGAVVGIILLLELVMAVGGWKIAPAAAVLRMSPMPLGISNTDAIGRILYTQYAFLFETSSVVLMVAMIGAIVLTHRERTRSKSQNIARQNARQPADTLTMMDVPIGVGVKQLGILRPGPALAAPGEKITLPETDHVAVTHKPGAH